MKIVPVSDDADVDVELCFVTTPPTMTPVSTRAKVWFELPEGVLGAILCGTVEETLGTLPEDYTLRNVDEPPSFVAIIGLARLH